MLILSEAKERTERMLEEKFNIYYSKVENLLDYVTNITNQLKFWEKELNLELATLSDLLIKNQKIEQANLLNGWFEKEMLPRTTAQDFYNLINTIDLAITGFLNGDIHENLEELDKSEKLESLGDEIESVFWNYLDELIYEMSNIRFSIQGEKEGINGVKMSPMI